MLRRICYEYYRKTCLSILNIHNTVKPTLKSDVKTFIRVYYVILHLSVSLVGLCARPQAVYHHIATFKAKNCIPAALFSCLQQISNVGELHGSIFSKNAF